MCGIAGVLSANLDTQVEEKLFLMQEAMHHRGPDDRGIFLHVPHAALAHVRLAIFDPQHGHQPFVSHDGRYVIVFNGAIYNHPELRRELISRGHPIQSYCDTEVLLYAYKEWGQSCLEKLNGMFAFCIWDKKSLAGFIARDRVGIKPFYYHTRV